jgi:hypothetical protein
VLLLWVAIAAVLVGVVAALLTKGTVVVTSRLGGERVTRILADAEYIVEHRAVPPEWQTKLGKRLRGPRSGGAEPRVQARHQAKARRWCLRELRRLIGFARTTSIVADEEARAILLTQLSGVGAKWRNLSWDEMCRPGDGDELTIAPVAGR